MIRGWGGHQVSSCVSATSKTLSSQKFFPSISLTLPDFNCLATANPVLAVISGCPVFPPPCIPSTPFFLKLLVTSGIVELLKLFNRVLLANSVEEDGEEEEEEDVAKDVKLVPNEKLLIGGFVLAGIKRFMMVVLVVVVVFITLVVVLSPPFAVVDFSLPATRGGLEKV